MSTWVLQVNVSGAWRDVCPLLVEYADEVAAAAGLLARVIGWAATWRIVEKTDGYAHVRYDDGKIRGAAAPVKSADLEAAARACQAVGQEESAFKYQRYWTDRCAAAVRAIGQPPTAPRR